MKCQKKLCGDCGVGPVTTRLTKCCTAGRYVTSLSPACSKFVRHRTPWSIIEYLILAGIVGALGAVALRVWQQSMW
jgi:hypothetical protein